MYIFMPFLYFPEDKTEYIPAVLSLLAFMVLAGIAMFLFYKKSKKDEREFNEKYEQILKEATKSSPQK